MLDPACLCPATDQTETFWSLLHNLAHWEFELFLQLVVDGIIVGIGWRICWARLRKHFQHHQCPEEEKDK